MQKKTKEKNKRKKETETIYQEPKPFKQGDMVKITSGLHKGKEGEIFDMEIRIIKTEKNKSEKIVFFDVIIEGCFLELINQDFLDPKGKKGKK